MLVWDIGIPAIPTICSRRLVTSRGLLAESGAQRVQEVRGLGAPVVRFSPECWADLREIRSFLFIRMYRAPSVMVKRAEVTQVVNDLFPHFMAAPQDLPAKWQADADKAGGSETALARVVSDYVSGMTDRFALQEHARLFGRG